MIFPPRRMAPGERLTAANYNALLDYVRRITPLAGANVTVDYRLGGAVISSAGGAGAGTSGVKPFTVRYHEDQWEIYLPDGCVNAGGTCEALNPAASGFRGMDDGGFDHVGDADGWRILYLNERIGKTETDSADNSYREWKVTVHVKTSAKIYGVDALGSPARGLVWASVSDRLKSDTQITDAERYADTPGDAVSFVVATIRVTTIQTEEQNRDEYVRDVTQNRDTIFEFHDVPTPTGLDLVWYLSVADAHSASGGSLHVNNVYCLRQLVAVAGIAVTGDQMTDVKDAEWIYAKIDSADMNSGEGILSVVGDPSGPHSSDSFVTWLPLYRMNENTVTDDYRENSLKNIQLYRA